MPRFGVEERLLAELGAGLGWGSVAQSEVLYLIMSGSPDTFVDISAAWEAKWDAVRQHRSQGRDAEGMHGFFQSIALDLGGRSSLGLAEGFRRLLPT